MTHPISTERELAGRVAFVVGGSSGIGWHAAVLLARRGARVAIVADRDVEAAVARAAEAGVELMGVGGDASNYAFMAEAAARVGARLGRITIAVNSVAIHPYANAGDTTEAVWDRVMAVNVKSVFLTAHHTIPQMLAAGGGAIVNVSSIQATACQRDVSAYTTSKAAILGFTRSLAVDYTGRGIRANAVSPGAIRTPLLDLSVAKFGGGRPAEEVFADWGRGMPAGRIGEPGEVAEMIAFLAGPRASYCSGGEYVVDGATVVKSGV
ncbi:MAG: SDR family oxidoreductase [Burkholderiales bacterium]|nr:SDR family oxidoreductase [Burkholderiales bacterium]MDE2455088.1 SDR family oxidoreductase [Burkholderiales bacterium]